MTDSKQLKNDIEMQREKSKLEKDQENLHLNELL